MGFIDDKYTVVGKNQSDGEGSLTEEINHDGLREWSNSPTGDVLGDQSKIEIKLTEEQARALGINIDDPYLREDLNLVIKAFEVECAQWSEEDYAVAYHYRDVYNTRQFSYRVQQQMKYYPGMHQTGYIPHEDPQLTEARKMAGERLDYWNRAMDNPDAFMNGLKSRQRDFDYSKLFDKDDKGKNWGKMLTECIPCFDRLLDGADLLPDGDLLQLHLLNIKLRTDILDKLKDLLKDPGYYLDICELLRMLSSLCPQDLLAILALLTQYLAKLNLEVKFNLDFIVELVGPILSPFLDALADWLDKWIQMILRPLICVVDHINETILLAQQIKVPLSEVNFSAEGDVGVALPFHKNFSSGSETGLKGPNRSDKGAWTGGEAEFFETPDSEKYNPEPPEPPREETNLSLQEAGDSWRSIKDPDTVEENRQQRESQWNDLRDKEQKKRRKVPPPLERSDANGRRWNKDNISEEDKRSYEFWLGERPLEEQATVKPTSDYYLDASPIINSITQLRNIMQAGIAYIQDWFEYVTQMIYDLMGTDFGWMDKKMNSTQMKSRIIQLIYIVKALIEAISKNGLKCGVNSNFDNRQLVFILERVLNEASPTYSFSVQEDGSVLMVPPEGPLQAETVDKSQAALEGPRGAVYDTGTVERDKVDGVQQAPTRPEDDRILKQKSVASGIIIKDCLKDISSDRVAEVRQWIADFEVGGN